MDRRSNWRARRPARRHPRELRAGGLPGRAGRGSAVPGLAAARDRAGMAETAVTCCGRLTVRGATTLRHVTTYRGHDWRSVSAQTRHYAIAQSRRTALPSQLLLP